MLFHITAKSGVGYGFILRINRRAQYSCHLNNKEWRVWYFY